MLTSLLRPWLALMPGQTRLREGILNDCARLAQIHAEGFAHPWERLDFENLMIGGALSEVMLSQGLFGQIITGFALSKIAADEAELFTIALDREERGKGHAAPLLRQHAAQLRRAGAQSLFLEVAEDNAPALALYRGMGFAEIGRRKGYYANGAGPRRDALTMRLDLSPLDPTPRY